MNLGKVIWVFFVLFLFLPRFYKFTLFPNKKFKNLKKNAKEFCQQTLSVHTSILNYFIDLLVKH